MPYPYQLYVYILRGFLFSLENPTMCKLSTNSTNILANHVCTTEKTVVCSVALAHNHFVTAYCK